MAINHFLSSFRPKTTTTTSRTWSSYNHLCFLMSHTTYERDNNFPNPPLPPARTSWERASRFRERLSQITIAPRNNSPHREITVLARLSTSTSPQVLHTYPDGIIIYYAPTQDAAESRSRCPKPANSEAVRRDE